MGVSIPSDGDRTVGKRESGRGDWAVRLRARGPNGPGEGENRDGPARFGPRGLGI